MNAQESVEQDFRFERKFTAHLSAGAAEVFIKTAPATFREVHRPRCVNNIYFETEAFESFLDNIDGHGRRLKVRIRWYGALFRTVEKPVLELKLKDLYVGSKRRFPLASFRFDQNFDFRSLSQILRRADLDPQIGDLIAHFRPVLVNRYHRKYFLSADGRFRLTLDSDFEFYPTRSAGRMVTAKVRQDDFVVLELKYAVANAEFADTVFRDLPFRVSRHSKYVTGIKVLYGGTL